MLRALVGGELMATALKQASIDLASLVTEEAMAAKQAALQFAIAQIERQFRGAPKPQGQKPKWGLRRGATRGAGRLPMIYMMQCTACGLVKIGVSGDYRQRRIELEKQTGHTLTVLGIEIGGLQEESWTHSRFSVHRVRGEWYRPDEALLTYAREEMGVPWEKRS